MKLVVVGAAGRMGRMLIKTMSETAGVTLHGAIEAAGSPHIGADSGQLAGIGENGIKITSDALSSFLTADGVLDFTVPKATLEFAALAAQARIVHIIGTTGMTETDLAAVQAAARHAVIVRSGNMSFGMNLLAALVTRVAKALGEDYDIEIVESHHRMKVDAPSGAALMLGEAAAAGRGIDLKDHSARGRDGITGARKSGDIGFASLRGGSIIGDHTVVFAGDAERIELTHKADDRSLFARGTMKAALWARDKKPGLYSMMDVLGLQDF